MQVDIHNSTKGNIVYTALKWEFPEGLAKKTSRKAQNPEMVVSDRLYNWFLVFAFNFDAKHTTDAPAWNVSPEYLAHDGRTTMSVAASGIAC